MNHVNLVWLLLIQHKLEVINLYQKVSSMVKFYAQTPNLLNHINNYIGPMPRSCGDKIERLSHQKTWLKTYFQPTPLVNQEVNLKTLVFTLLFKIWIINYFITHQTENLHYYKNSTCRISISLWIDPLLTTNASHWGYLRCIIKLLYRVDLVKSSKTVGLRPRTSINLAPLPGNDCQN